MFKVATRSCHCDASSSRTDHVYWDYEQDKNLFLSAENFKTWFRFTSTGTLTQIVHLRQHWSGFVSVCTWETQPKLGFKPLCRETWRLQLTDASHPIWLRLSGSTKRETQSTNPRWLETKVTSFKSPTTQEKQKKHVSVKSVRWLHWSTTPPYFSKLDCVFNLLLLQLFPQSFKL